MDTIRGIPRQRGTGAVFAARTETIVCLVVAVVVGGACSDTTLDLFDPDKGLLAHWALDEAPSNKIVLDSSGFGNHGKLSTKPPVPTRDVPPVHFDDPYSLSFNGQDQWITLGNPALLNAGGPTTMAAWVRSPKLDGTQNILGHGYVFWPNHDFALRIKAGTYQFTMWDSTVDIAAAASIPAGDPGTWVHLCGVFDGSAYYLYRNGDLAASTTAATPPAADIDASWGIGAAGGGGDYLLQGELDDIRLYGRALSPAEVAALYRR